MLVTLSFANDPHAAAAQLYLADRGIASLTLFVDRLWKSDSLQYGWNNGFASPTVDPLINEALQQPFALWLRRPNFYVHSLPTTEKGLFARQEWRAAVEWLIAGLTAKAAITVNPWEALSLARNKPAQLQAASELGFNIPNTLMSNSRAEIAQFVARYDSICKSFSPFTEGSGVDQRVFYTRRLSAADVEALDPVLGVPLIVQERIEKSYEVRAAFVDGRAYCLKIPGDYESSGSVDWREQPFSSLETVPIELSPETTERCLGLLDRFSLKMASLDFIVDRNGKLWFLELNEQGNFLFLDRVYGESRVLGAFCDMVTGPLGLVGKEVSACLPETMLERVGALFNGEHESDPNSFFRRLGCAQ